MTRILLCVCSHPYQDAKYGEKKRVHNFAAKKSTKEEKLWRCTVCGRLGPAVG